MTERPQVVEALEADRPADATGVERSPAAAGAGRSVSRLARPPARDVLMLAGLVTVTAFLWGRAAEMSFWLDEGISVGVASHPLRAIPSVLVQDGSPPLYYLVLHVWVSAFGSSAVATHALSLLFAVAVLPAGLWAGWSLFGRRTGWMFALLVAINPFAAYYATETRMYSMAMLLAVLGVATFVHAFVFGRRRYLPWFALCQALLMYTHNWGILMSLGLAAAVVPCLILDSDRRRVLTDAALGFGAVAVLYLPWVPSLLDQVGGNLQPWGRKADLFWVRDHVARLVGGDAAFVALGIGAGVGIVAVLQTKKWTRNSVAILVLAVMALVALAAGWRGSVWAYRYLAVLVGPILLLAALGMAHGRQVAVAAIGVVAFLSGPFAVKGPAYQKSNAEAVADEVAPRLQPGDLVVVPDFEMIPLLAHYLPAGLRYASASGPVPDERIVDWRNSLDRLRADDPAVTLPPLIDSLPIGGHLLFVCPPPESITDATGLDQSEGAPRSGDDGSTTTDNEPGAVADSPSADEPGTAASGAADPEPTEPEPAVEPTTTPMPDDVQFHPLILLRCRQTQRLVTNHPALRLDQVLTAPNGVRYTSVDARLLTRVGAPAGP